MWSSEVDSPERIKVEVSAGISEFAEVFPEQTLGCLSHRDPGCSSAFSWPKRLHEEHRARWRVWYSRVFPDGPLSSLTPPKEQKDRQRVTVPDTIYSDFPSFAGLGARTPINFSVTDCRTRQVNQ